MRRHRTAPFLWLLAAASASSGCATVVHHKQTRDVVVGERVTDEDLESVVVESPRLFVRDVRVASTALHGRLEMAGVCREDLVETVVREMNRESVWVDDAGEIASLGKTGGLEVGLGFTMPLVVPIAVVAGADASDINGNTLEIAFYTGIVAGVGLIVSGIVDAIAALTVGVEDAWQAHPVERRSTMNEAFSCDVGPPQARRGTLYVGTATTSIAVEEGGAFVVDLAPFVEVGADLRTAVVEIGTGEDTQVARVGLTASDRERLRDAFVE